MITVSHISRSFGSLRVLDDISLEIRRGEVLAITGPSGAGKTTLLQIIGSLDRPDSGTVVYGDRDIFTLPEKKLSQFRNRNIGFVFQSSQLLPEFSTLENVALPALIGGRSRHDAFESARKLLDYLGLSHRLDHRPAQLSGGERQRTAVARALINEPAVVLADEPSGSLDSQGRAEMHRLFFDLRRDLGHTFVIVTHDDTLASDTDRQVCMADGRIISVINRTGTI
ncbi:MAG: ABC transporter ATP-binding protein [Muribaculaceae bacterium]|nr:ABC transporter ATP-binding protein [Muribaculaceae bacterium]